MIYSDSRYATGTVYRAYKPSTDDFEVAVDREFPAVTSNYFVYEWRVGDRIDAVAYTYFRNADEWWRIMDVNPEVSNPHAIAPGTKLRIPNAPRA